MKNKKESSDKKLDNDNKQQLAADNQPTGRYFYLVQLLFLFDSSEKNVEKNSRRR